MMSSKSTYTFKWNTTKLGQLSKDVFKGMKALAYQIDAEAKHGAPVDTGVLVNSIRVTDDNNGHIFVLAGGRFLDKDIPYAKRQEYENKRHPFYMKNAFAWAEQNYTKYFKGITK